MNEWMELRDGEFEERVLGADTPVLVEFWAPWCGPCRKFAPVIAAVMEGYRGRIQRLQVNTDEAEELPEVCAVTSIPTLILFHRGEEIGRFVGKMSREALDEKIRQALGGGEAGDRL